MSIDTTLAKIDALLGKLVDHDQCPKCGRWWQLRPNSSRIARYTCCGTTYDINLAREPRIG